MDEKRWYKICGDLASRSRLFQGAMQLGLPKESNEVPTAAVAMNPDGSNARLLYNKEWLNKLTDIEISFVMGHEILHALFNHIPRIDKLMKEINIKQNTYGFEGFIRTCNVAADIIVNNTLVNSYGFSPYDLPFLIRDGCWDINGRGGKTADEIVSTCRDISQHYTFEGIYWRLCFPSNNPHQEPGTFGVLLRGHLDKGLYETLAGAIAAEASKGLSEEDLGKILASAETNALIAAAEVGADDVDLVSSSGQGDSNTPIIFDISKLVEIKTRNWERIIKRWTRNYEDYFENVESWALRNRRNTLLDPDLIMINEVQTFDVQAHRMNVFVLMDFSGSCQDWSPKFLSIVRNLPKDRFHIYPHAFGNTVAAVDVNDLSETYYDVGGGTSFAPFNAAIERWMESTKNPYPDAVFVITDGEGTRMLSPQHPERWHWFLHPNALTCGHIPVGCNFYPLYSVAPQMKVK